MASFTLLNSIIYRWRYLWGYSLLGLILIFVLGGAALFIPGSLSENEHASIISSAVFHGTNPLENISINTPYYLLQNLSLSIFGVTLIGIKLPSIILGVITASALLILLRLWFSHGIAILTSIIIISTSRFIFFSQQGSPDILHILWPTLLLLFATLISQRSKLQPVWIIAGLVTAALSLYTPLNGYIILAMIGATLLHPHLRFILKKIPLKATIAGGIAALLILTPLIISIVSEPKIALGLLGIPTGKLDLLKNLSIVLSEFNVLSVGSGSVMLPVIGLSSLLIIAYGAYVMRGSLQTVQSYVIFSWMILLFIALILSVEHISVIFVPLTLLLAIGLEALLGRWYKLFPLNPYARVAGLLPLVILILSMTLFGLQRYSLGYRYAPEIVKNFSSDLQLMPKDKYLIVSKSEKPLYDAVATYTPDLIVETEIPSTNNIALTRKAFYSTKDLPIPEKIITSQRYEDSDRFYIF